MDSNRTKDTQERQHLVLLQHQKVQDAVDAGVYRVNSELEPLARQHPYSEDFLLALRDQGKCKEGCAFLASTLHRRVSVWWGYLCVVDLLRELRQKPAEVEDLMKLAAPGSIDVPTPDWAKVPPPRPPVEIDKTLAEIKSALNEPQELLEKLPAAPREMMQMITSSIDAAFKETTGMGHDEFVMGMCRRVLESRDAERIDFENSPITKMMNDIKSKIEGIRTETLQTVKDALPTPDPKLLAKQKRNSLDAVYAYIAAPSDENAKRCMDIGNEIPDQPEGLLALCAFWSFGNMTPEGKEVIKTPSSLLCRGMDSLLLTCGLAKGGTRKLKERMERYLGFGLAAASGESNWGESVEQNLAPHRELASSGDEDMVQAGGRKRFRIDD
ncbi:MAG: hypothetical protein K6A65_02475 [Succinivibrionaceae bacterium]|nr:hypothetical protein [Succinivibrionaceae bacterium]